MKGFRGIDGTVTYTISLVLLLFTSSAEAFLINEDVKQPFEDPQDNYEVVLEGDWRDVEVDPGHVINAFSNGDVDVFYEAGPPERTTVSFSGDPISQGPDYHHFGFGYGISEERSKIVGQYWTSGTAEKEVPGVSHDFHYYPYSGDLLVTLENNTEKSLRLRDIGYRVFYDDVPLAELNREDMPPGSFTSMGLGEPVLAPGEAVDGYGRDVDITSGVVVFVTAEFFEADPEEYDEDEGIWVYIHMDDLAPIEPESLGRIKSQFH